MSEKKTSLHADLKIIKVCIIHGDSNDMLTKANYDIYRTIAWEQVMQAKPKSMGSGGSKESAST